MSAPAIRVWVSHAGGGHSLLNLSDEWAQCMEFVPLRPRMANVVHSICGLIISHEAEGGSLVVRLVMARYPWLPSLEERDLGDAAMRENFIERVFVCQRWWQLLDEGLTAARLVEFHTRHKYMLMARGADVYRQLGQMVADAGKADLDALAQRYFPALMKALQRLASRGRHSNVLLHLMGYLKRQIEPCEKQELLGLIDAYRRGELPWTVPVSMLKHHLDKYPEAYLQRQHYLAPYPQEQMLRNSI